MGIPVIRIAYVLSICIFVGLLFSVFFNVLEKVSEEIKKMRCDRD